MDYLFPPETLDHSGFPHVLVRAVTQAEVVALAPSPNQAVPRQRQRELGSAFDLTYPHTVQFLHILPKIMDVEDIRFSDDGVLAFFRS